MRTRNFFRSYRPGLLGRLPAYLLGAILSTGMALSVNTYAVHDLGVFELDNGTTGANAIDELEHGDDWAQTDNCPPGLDSCGYVSGPNVDPDNPGGTAFKSLFIQDPNGEANTDSVFTGGTTKDDLDLYKWNWAQGSTPDKDDLLPLGAAAYLTDLTDDNVDDPQLLIYLFGSLFAPNGNAAIGAWLFKKNIGQCADGTFGVIDSNDNCLPAAQQPINLHSIGDVFVVAQNTNGGRNVEMEVYKWVDEDTARGPQGSDTAAASAAKIACVADLDNDGDPDGTLVNNNLCRVFAENEALCVDGLTNDEACGTMNLGETKGNNGQPAVPTESPDDWGYQAKESFRPDDDPNNPSPPGTNGIDANDFPGTTLFEAGFNFNKLFPNSVGCFNSFLMNTRASQSVSSVLKDVGLGKFQLCGIKVDKSGPEKSKIGDAADFTFTITNIGAITLYLDSIVDDKFGDLEAAAVAANPSCASLAPQASCTFTVEKTIPVGSPDEFVNTVMVHYNSAQNLQGDDQSATDNHTVNLFQPSITFDKTGDTLSKATDTTGYTITLNNTSSDDTPDLVCTITDPKLGLDVDVTLASGASHVLTPSYVVLPGDPDPLLNTASVTCSPTGFPNIYATSDSHSTNLFQPSITLDKTGDTLSKVGDPVDYTITLSNTSSSDSPALNCTIVDTKLGINEPVSLASGANKVINKQYIVQPNDPDPLVNTASVTCSPQGFPNQLTANDSHTVNLFQPSVRVVKEGDLLSKVGDSVTYTITVTNTSSTDSPNLVNGSIVDTLLGNLLAANSHVNNSSCNSSLAQGASCVIQATRTVLANDADPLLNTVTVHYNPQGFPNDITDSDSHSVNLFQPAVTVNKTANCTPNVIAGQTITYSYMITNTSSNDSPNLELASVVDDKLGNLAVPAAAANCGTLAPNASCTFSAPYATSSVGTILNKVDVLYHPAGFPNNISATDQQSCIVVPPPPATVVFEKVLLNAENLAFSYSTPNNLPVLSFQLTPLFGQLPLLNSPFADPLPGQSFASSTEYKVDIESIGVTKQVDFSEVLPLPPFINAVSLNCAAADEGTLTGYQNSTLTLGSGDFAFCRFVNQFNPGTEGCTPGFWKQVHHFGHWLPTGYLPVAYQGDPATLLQDVFDFSGVTTTPNPNDLEVTSLADDTMLAGLGYPGGKGKYGAAQILLRAAVAAVLNASSVQYPIAKADVIAQVNAALSSNNRDTMLALATELDNANNGVLLPDGGGTEDCPLSGQSLLQ